MPDKPIVKIHELPMGGVFELNNNFHMRIADDRNGRCCICNLKNGGTMTGVEDWLVTPIKIEIKLVEGT